jgi:lipopolysaccharide/colanic/teichoic acid biosynthesis glycosyltransferase
MFEKSSLSLSAVRAEFGRVSEPIRRFVADQRCFAGAEVFLYRFIKRALDTLVALILLVALSPILLFAMLAILVLEGRPIFYVSKRHTTAHREVSIAKFRTMVRDASSPKYDLYGRFMQDGYLDIPVSCEVYTGVGRVLERTQLVETLQLVNVLFHQMSFIGNRPLPERNLQHLQKFAGWQERFDSPAGMTGISQVVGKFNLQPEERLELERLYSKVYREGNVLKCDIEIVFFTARLIATGKSISLEYARGLLERCL